MDKLVSDDEENQKYIIEKYFEKDSNIVENYFKHFKTWSIESKRSKINLMIKTFLKEEQDV